MRTADPRSSGIRALTQAYHPNFLSVDLAKSSLWTHLQYCNGITQLREKDVCVNLAHKLVHHSAAFTWRSHNDEEIEHNENEPARPIVTGVKGEAAAFQTFAMCYVNDNRKGRDGVTIAIGLHQKWLGNQRQRGSKVELIYICMAALKFFGDRHADLHGLSFRNLQ